MSGHHATTSDITMTSIQRVMSLWIDMSPYTDQGESSHLESACPYELTCRHILIILSPATTCMGLHAKISSCYESSCDIQDSFLRLRSSVQSVAWSMGLMMKGMAASPVASMTHLRVWAGRAVDRCRTWPVNQQMRLMVKPGTATDARPCHTRVSTTDAVTFFVFSESLNHGSCNRLSGQLSYPWYEQMLYEAISTEIFSGLTDITQSPWGGSTSLNSAWWFILCCCCHQGSLTPRTE